MHSMLPAKCKWLHFSWATLYSKADLTDKQLSQEQKHGQQYFLDIRPHKLFAVEN